MAPKIIRTRSQLRTLVPDSDSPPPNPPSQPIPSRPGRTSAEFHSFSALENPLSSTPFLRRSRDRSSVIDSEFGDITEQLADPLNDEELVPEAPDFIDTPPDDAPIPIVPDTDAAELVSTSALTQLAQAITTLARHA